MKTTLALLANRYEERDGEKPAPIELFVAPVKKTQSKTKVASKKEASYAPPKPVFVPGPKTEPLPAKGTIDATQFLKGLARCKDRDDQVKLIASFVGYDNTVLHGTQLDQARAKAHNMIRGVEAAKTEYKHGASPSLGGYVAGMSDEIEKRRKDLKAREVHATSEMLYHEKAGRKELAAKYRGSLTAIRKELASL